MVIAVLATPTHSSDGDIVRAEAASIKASASAGGCLGRCDSQHAPLRLWPELLKVACSVCEFTLGFAAAKRKSRLCPERNCRLYNEGRNLPCSQREWSRPAFAKVSRKLAKTPDCTRMRKRMWAVVEWVSGKPPCVAAVSTPSKLAGGMIEEPFYCFCSTDRRCRA